MTPVTQHIKTFKREEDGGILVFVVLALAAVLGLVAVVFDIGRLANTQTELQSFADNVALAAAGELDGNTDAITRANLAAVSLVDGSQTFAEGSTVLAGAVDATVVYLNDLPASDTASTATFQTTDATEAIYAQVTITPRTVRMPFTRAFAVLTGSAPADAQAGATAVAGFTRYACDITPLMFCLPSGNYKADANKGDTILLRSGGGGAAWGPGDFGFLDVSSSQINPNGPCAGLNGAKLTACMIAATGNIGACFAQRGVDTEPGQKVGLENSIFNTRFDMFNTMMSQFRNDPAYAPGPHVVKGLKNNNGNNACVGNSNVVTDDTMAFPEDDCFISGTCATVPGNSGSSRFGNGDWTSGRDQYANTNHGPNDMSQVFADPFATDSSGNAISTRYDYYKAEIEAAKTKPNPNTNNILSNTQDETGRPQCSTSPVIEDPERRVFIAAAIDCGANPINGAETNVPVAEFFKVFLIKPVGESASSPPSFDLFVEVVGSAGGDGAGNASIAGSFRDVVQLYR